MFYIMKKMIRFFGLNRNILFFSAQSFHSFSS
uniref:Uncharacterized protein n=2 Tax=unclassified Caudoviricetes TaxID=2788787 RepID=A0A8S5PI03_9CAUD|nr:MAG TPA: hypothetical protein [Siphoviridae sp. ctJcm18]DAE06702.1 MAG TPA: hypothetical protein [Siphoviridae sp. ctUGQ45]